ncbi:cyclin-dependent kinase F-4-like protein isoform X1 [Tanacetum coccineum]
MCPRQNAIKKFFYQKFFSPKRNNGLQLGTKRNLWGVGEIMAELFTLRPLFPGSSKADEIYKIYSVIGSLTEFTRREGLERASKIRYQFPEICEVLISGSISNRVFSLERERLESRERKREEED